QRGESGARLIDAGAVLSRQEVAVDGLQPGKRYRWRVRVGQERAEGSFMTAPQAGQPVRFVVFGDSRSNPERCRAVAGAILETGVGLAVHTGDLVRAGRDLSLWNREFFEPLGELMRSVVIFPAIGNHELGGPRQGPDGRKVFADFFVLPGNERYYSFDYGDVHFCVLDSNGRQSVDSPQYRWAEKDLIGSRARWKIVVFHHPIYCAGNHQSHISMRTTYGPLLARAGVAVIFSGHDHNYQRSRPVVHELAGGGRGPYWQVVTGGGGANCYNVRFDELWADKAYKGLHFVEVQVAGPVLRARALDPQGKLLDEWVIDQRRRPTETLAYERIELVRLLSRAQLLDEQGRPVRLLFDQAGQSRQFVATWHNRLEVPVELVIEASWPTGVEVSPARESLKLAAAGKDGASREMGFRVSLAEAREAYEPVKLLGRVSSRFGTDALKPVVLPVGVRRRMTVAASSGAVKVDGRIDEPAWQAVGAVDGFVDGASGSRLPAGRSPRLRLLTDSKRLYVAMVVPLAKDYRPRQRGSISRSDHVMILAVGPSGAAKLLLDATGRTRGPKQASCAGGARAENWWCEASIPLELVGVSAGQRSLQFNIGVRMGRKWAVWSPTAGGAISAQSCGWLDLP
ncbi:MAG: metallophosphoesterase, partial [Phycisphaerae bacterium]